MPQLHIHEATKEDVPTIVALLGEMQGEIKELPFDAAIAREVVIQSLDECVHWFLFRDAEGASVGTCFLQSIHNYWRRDRRFIVGGFFLRPDYRGTGVFQEIVDQLKDWANAKGGFQLLAFIQEDNEKSLKAFGSVGLQKNDMLLRVCNFRPLS